MPMVVDNAGAPVFCSTALADWMNAAAATGLVVTPVCRHPIVCSLCPFCAHSPLFATHRSHHQAGDCPSRTCVTGALVCESAWFPLFAPVVPLVTFPCHCHLFAPVRDCPSLSPVPCRATRRPKRERRVPEPERGLQGPNACEHDKN